MSAEMVSHTENVIFIYDDTHVLGNRMAGWCTLLE